MKWIDYKKKYTESGLQIGYSEEVINSLLSYAEPLFNLNLPVIYDQVHFSLLVGYDYELILKIANAQKWFYKEFSIPKKDGSLRLVFEPLPTLKEIQKWILDNILYKIEVSPTAKAYVKNGSIKENAKFHRKQKKVINIDIKDFFNSVTSYQVYTVFRKIGYNNSVAKLLSQICTLDGHLPQGAPTSPMLSNIVFRPIDNRIFGYCLRNKVRYSRYADDITFSGEHFSNSVISFTRDIIKQYGFDLNDKKTRVQLAHQRQDVTGVVVNQKMQAKKEYRRRIRQQIYYLKKFGLSEQFKVYNFESPQKYLYHLIGKSYFVLFINPKDKEALSNIKYLNYLLSINK